MTTFEGIINAIIYGFSTFLPISVSAHTLLLPQLFHIAAPQGPALGAMALGCLLAILIFFRHDFASMLSSILQVVLFRKFPRTLDERLPIFLLLSLIPVAVAWFYFRGAILGYFESPLWVAGSLAVFGALLWVAEHFGRKSKNMYDWNWLDSLFVGFAYCLCLVPGVGAVSAALGGALFRNYRAEAAAKYALFLATPSLAFSTWLLFHGQPLSERLSNAQMSTLTFWLMVLVAMLCGLLATGGFMRHVQKRGIGAYLSYRIVVGIGAMAWMYYKGL